MKQALQVKRPDSSTSSAGNLLCDPESLNYTS